MTICCTPKDIFLEPHIRFVAEFIGGKNILAATVVGHDPDGLVQLDSKHGGLLARRRDKMVQVGEQVAVCISAEHIDLTTQPSNRNHLACNVVGEEFIGSMVNLYLEGRDGLELKVQKSYADYNRLGLIAGQQVFAEWSDSDALMLRSSL